MACARSAPLRPQVLQPEDSEQVEGKGRQLPQPRARGLVFEELFSGAEIHLLTVLFEGVRQDYRDAANFCTVNFCLSSENRNVRYLR